MGFFNLFGSKKEKTGQAEQPEQTEPGVFEKIRQAVRQTQENFTERMQDLVVGRKEIDPEMLEELEAIMIGADIGVGTTAEILDSIRDQVSRRTLEDPAQLRGAVKAELRKILSINDAAPKSSADDGPFVILMVGVNGVGKTTTIGKIATRLARDGRRVLLGAGDTFRAAASEQLDLWAERAGVEIVRQERGADPASVVFDAYARAKSRGFDTLIIDTAGRLHTKSNLIEELKKVVRVLAKQDASLPDEVLLVLDATTGQNALAQARTFVGAVGVTGLVVTKLDGTSKGGVLLALTEELSIPVRYIGLGEGQEDLQDFDPEAFVDALLEEGVAS